tara:strand:- start:3067 stop:3600 length:534 start_codon:yes stop_codon:yes gene_type:complete
MADTGKLVGSAQILPDELVRIISGITYSYTPSAGDQWYYKLTNVPISSPVDLIGGNFLQGATTSAGTDAGSSPAAVATGDIVKFLFIKNTGLEHDGSTSITGSVYLSLNGNTTGDLAEIAAADNDIIEIGPGESLALKINCTVADLHCEAGTPGFATQALTTSKKIQCIVAAVLDDV